MQHAQSKIEVLSKEGSRLPALIVAEDIEIGGGEIYRIVINYMGNSVSADSERGFFDALCKVRLILEKDGALVRCLGASEDVYPSPMQESMGAGLLAYRTEMGRQAFSTDIVNILDLDESLRPSTVAEQRSFHMRWLQSLAKRNEHT